MNRDNLTKDALKMKILKKNKGNIKKKTILKRGNQKKYSVKYKSEKEPF